MFRTTGAQRQNRAVVFFEISAPNHRWQIEVGYNSCGKSDIPTDVGQESNHLQYKIEANYRNHFE